MRLHYVLLYVDGATTKKYAAVFVSAKIEMKQSRFDDTEELDTYDG